MCDLREKVARQMRDSCWVLTKFPIHFTTREFVLLRKMDILRDVGADVVVVEAGA